jgi:hypothetical protein
MALTFSWPLVVGYDSVTAKLQKKCSFPAMGRWGQPYRKFVTWYGCPTVRTARFKQTLATPRRIQIAYIVIYSWFINLSMM